MSKYLGETGLSALVDKILTKINGLITRITNLESKQGVKTQIVDSLEDYKAMSSYDSNTLYCIPESED